MAGLDASVIGNLQPPQATSLGDLVNIARGVQGYQQAQQVNPIAVQQAQQQLQNTQTTGQTAQLQLANQQNQIAGGAITGLENSPSYKANDLKGIKKELEATEKWLKTVNPDFLKPGGVVDQAHQYIDQEDVEGYKNHLANIRRGLASPAEQYQAGLAQFNTNAQGTPFLTNRAAGTVTAPNVQGGGQNLTPTTAGVANFNDYQKDLTNRVAVAQQADMRINEAENLMKQFKPGAGSQTYIDIAKKLQAVNAPQELVDKVAKGDISAGQSLQKFISQAVTAQMGQLPGSPTANTLNEYLKNNPDIANDPRALQRFFDFAHKANQTAYDEQDYLVNKLKDKSFNADTHPLEAQQMLREKYLSKSPSTSNENVSTTKKVVKTGMYNGKKVVQYEDGSVGYQ